MRGRFYIEDPAPADAEVYSKLKFARIQDASGKVLCKAWRGKQGRPYAYYTFRSVEAREAWISREKEAEDGRNAYRTEREKSDAERVAKYSEQIQVGTLLSGSWGYDQTNAELYQVVERKGLTVIIREVACESVPGSAGFMSEMIKPVPGKFCGEPISRRITHNGVKLNDCCHLSPCSADDKHYSSWYA